MLQDQYLRSLMEPERGGAERKETTGRSFVARTPVSPTVPAEAPTHSNQPPPPEDVLTTCSDSVEHVHALANVLCTFACPEFGLRLTELEPVVGLL